MTGQTSTAAAAGPVNGSVAEIDWALSDEFTTAAAADPSNGSVEDWALLPELATAAAAGPGNGSVKKRDASEETKRDGVDEA